MHHASLLSPAPTTYKMAPPQPTSTAETISPHDLHALLTNESKVAGRDYVVVDVRRTDIDVSHRRKTTALLHG